MTKARGNPRSYSPAIVAEMERLWCKTDLAQPAIVAQINAAYELDLDLDQLKNRASRYGWHREMTFQAKRSPAMIEQSLRTAAWLRWADRTEKRPDNAVKHVPPGTFPVKGYRMGGAS